MTTESNQSIIQEHQHKPVLGVDVSYPKQEELYINYSMQLCSEKFDLSVK